MFHMMIKLLESVRKPQLLLFQNSAKSLCSNRSTDRKKFVCKRS